MTTAQEIIKTKVGMLDLATQLGNMSDACRIRGDRCDRFYRFRELSERGGDRRSGLRSATQRTRPSPPPICSPTGWCAASAARHPA